MGSHLFVGVPKHFHTAIGVKPLCLRSSSTDSFVWLAKGDILHHFWGATSALGPKKQRCSGVCTIQTPFAQVPQRSNQNTFFIGSSTRIVSVCLACEKYPQATASHWNGGEKAGKLEARWQCMCCHTDPCDAVYRPERYRWVSRSGSG